MVIIQNSKVMIQESKNPRYRNKGERVYVYDHVKLIYISVGVPYI